MSLKTEVAWATGFVQGEGCFHFSKAKRLTLRVNQVDPEPLRKLAEIAGKGNVLGPKLYKSNKLGKKPYYTWTLSGWDVVDFFGRLEPYMIGTKVQQAQEACQQLIDHRQPDTIIL